MCNFQPSVSIPYAYGWGKGKVLQGKGGTGLSFVYDVASLTKPLVTAPLIQWILSTMGISLSSPATPPPGFTSFPFGTPTFEDLLCHQSGLPPWAPLYAIGNAEESRYILPSLQQEPPGHLCYSDLGYLFLGFWLESMTQKPLPCLFQKWLKENHPGLYYPFPSSLKGKTLPTERCDKVHTSLHHPLPYRPQPIWGFVHDMNAYFLGGYGGHAGLFGTLDGILSLLIRSLPLSPSKEIGYYQGWRIGEENLLIPRGYIGHTGFTGSFILYHPISQQWGVLLSHSLYEGHAVKTKLRQEFLSWFLHLNE